MRNVHVSEITRNIKEMCIEANHFLSEDMSAAMKNAVQTEESPLGKQILNQLQEAILRLPEKQRLIFKKRGYLGIWKQAFGPLDSN